MSWLEDTPNDEVHGILKWDMQDYNDTSMELVKQRMSMKNDDQTKEGDHWCMIEDFMQEHVP
jgi:hypothetical protein